MPVHRSGTAARAGEVNASSVASVGTRDERPVPRTQPQICCRIAHADLLAPSDVGVIGRRREYVGVSELDLFDYECELTLTPYRSRRSRPTGRPDYSALLAMIARF